MQRLWLQRVLSVVLCVGLLATGWTSVSACPCGAAQQGCCAAGEAGQDMVKNAKAETCGGSCSSVPGNDEDIARDEASLRGSCSCARPPADPAPTSPATLTVPMAQSSGAKVVASSPPTELQANSGRPWQSASMHAELALPSPPRIQLSVLLN